MAVYLITVKGPSGSHETSELEAEQYFTNDDRVTFWSAGRLRLPEPVAQFERAVVSAIVKKPGS
ncbi:MAG: hypothetical protein ABSH29_16575 [Acidimicrobiales bacterium]